MPICPICETNLSKDAFTEVYFSSFNNQKYRKYECPNCKVHWWEPLKIMPEFYESEIFENYISFHEGLRTEMGENHKAFFEKFSGKFKGKLLDIGCGDGIFLRVAQKQGFEIYGIDFDSKSVKIARKILKVDTIYAMNFGDFYEYCKEKKLKFDVITFFDVLEHQDEPKEFLFMAKDLLNHEGYVAGSVPNRESFFEINIYQKIFHWVDNPPHHFLRFSEEALKNTLKLIGFSKVQVHRLDFPKKELPAYIEKMLFGRSFDKIKFWLKSKALGDPRVVNVVAVDDLKDIHPGFISLTLHLFKRARNLFFFPLSIFYWRKIRQNGLHIYFQAKK